MILGGIVFGGYIGRKIDVGVPEYMMLDEAELESAEGKSTTSFGLTISTILVPLALILINTVLGVVLPENGAAAQVLNIIGDPFVALTVAVLMAFYVCSGRATGTPWGRCRVWRRRRWSRSG